MAVNIYRPHSNGGLGGINMGLCIFSGPKWEDDTLNDINEVSILLNTKDMFEERRVDRNKEKSKPLPTMLR